MCIRDRSYAGSSMTGWELESFYRKALVERGFHLVEPPPDAPRWGNSSILSAERDGKVTFLVFDTAEDGTGVASILMDRDGRIPGDGDAP
ncbi:MAG: hypothetical protein N2515_02170, partial [Deltaproteobacteria bacterium]|nr:hypothetical protein [Deltaproteobacteria bacterium]